MSPPLRMPLVPLPLAACALCVPLFASPLARADAPSVEEARDEATQAAEGAREAAKEKVGQAREATARTLKEARDEVEAARAQTREKLETARDEARDKLEHARDEARDKLETARDEVRDKLEHARGEVRDKLGEARDEAREKLEQAREELREAKQDARGKLGELKEELRAQAHAGIDLALGPPTAERAARMREQRRAELRLLQPHLARASDIPPPLREAMRAHARRTARLLRIRALAEGASDHASVARADKLLALERMRHKARLAVLLQQRSRAPASGHDEAEPEEPAADEGNGEDEP